MKMLVELCGLLQPKLTIMDAVIGMEGNGPGSGDPCTIGKIIAGRDAVAVDVIAGRLVGVSVEELPVLMAARSSGIGQTRSDRIRVLGEPEGDAAIKRFRLPPREHTEWGLPEWARSSLKNAFTTRPLINRELCVKCGICQGHCPQGAITDSKQGLEIRSRACIRCFCCQEFCPQGAITVGKGWALKIVS
jgi:Pyruvate/2-oxoacid:ferredoxin oxidoreductase delta subunit